MRRSRRLATVVAAKVAIALLGAAVAVVYVPNSVWGILLVGGLAAATLVIRPQQALALVVSVAVTTLVLEGLVRLQPRAVSPYYRPHEMLAAVGRHKASQTVRMRMPYGDLLAIDPQLDRAMAQPRDVVFRTDALGFRNDADYAGQQLIVVGDSFVVGDADTQSDTLTARLSSDHGIPAYNLGFQAGPVGYAERVLWARSTFAPTACFAMVLFEGNDFNVVTGADRAALQMVPPVLQRLIKGPTDAIRSASRLSRVTYGLQTRAMSVLAGRPSVAAPRRAFVHPVGKQMMAFLRDYADVVRRPAFDDEGVIRAQIARARPDALFFVPDKYRVYAPLFDEGAVTGLPHAQWTYLTRAAAEIGIAAHDLTPTLQEAAQRLLTRGETVFWRDDTHWSASGIAAGARAMASTLGGSAGTRGCPSTAPHPAVSGAGTSDPVTIARPASPDGGER